MKIKRMILLLLAVCLCLCACGGAGTARPSDEENQTQQDVLESAGTDDTPVETETMRWGDWTVDVPADFTLEGGDFLDETDPRYFSVKKSFFVYFDFTADGEELIMNHYNYNKATYTNEQTDVKGVFGGKEWVGFQYSDGYGGYGFEAYTTVDGEMIRVSCAGYRFDDAIVKTVLGSLTYTPPEPTPEETTPADTAIDDASVGGE
ncbi:MAG: hypothetical protein IJJ99_02505 [Oscillospiraceae bacterium]|nr:hypothetical protein [Oscillospiraceae bacterium]